MNNLHQNGMNLIIASGPCVTLPHQFGGNVATKQRFWENEIYAMRKTKEQKSIGSKTGCGCFSKCKLHHVFACLYVCMCVVGWVYMCVKEIVLNS